MTATVLKIRIYGDTCLRKKSAPVQEVGTAERMLIKSMIATMYAHKGIGLAAPQVGINQQIFVVDIGDGPIAVVNPQISNRRGVDVMDEGCLSIPGIQVKVQRPTQVTVRYTDQNNQPVERECCDLLARVFLHETDHLRGRLIVDYASFKAKLKIHNQLKELIRQSKTDSFAQ